MTDGGVLSVGELNNHIKGLLDQDPLLGRIGVRGELSNYRVYPSGHHYFTLKDTDAAVRCVMFRGEAGKLRFKPQDGMGVVCTGRVSVFPRDGAYQLYVSAMTPEGVGDLYLAYEQLKARLQAEGLFDRRHKKPLPAYPARIAVVTSGAGAAVRDIIRVLGKRWPLAKVLILPVRVQGAEAPAEIAGALRYADRWQVADLIITGRGGGSIEDLWAFNDERVARAIYESETPIISAVGHEPDVTIADFVADLRAATPSNGAELAVPEQGEMRQQLLSVRIRAEQSVKKRLDTLSARLAELASRPVLSGPTAALDLKRLETDSLSRRMTAAMRHSLSERKQEYIRLAASLDAMSPLKVLSRGFSVATDGAGRILTDVSAVSVGDRIQVALAHGGLSCRVEDKNGGQEHES